MRVARTLAAALTSAALVLAAGSPASAGITTDDDGVVIESLTADFTLGRGERGVSALTASETYLARFPASGESRGMRRDIAESTADAPRVLRLISITDADGAPRPSRVDSSDGVSSMTSLAPEGLRGTQTFVFTYTVDGVVSVGDGTRTQEFTWAVTGREPSPAVGELRATFRVPVELVPSLQGEPRCLIAPQGSSRTCDLAVNPGQLGAVLIEASADDLAADETMTVVVGFDAGTFTPSEEDGGAWIGWALALTAGALGVAAIGVVQRRRRGGVSEKDRPGQP